MPFLLFAGFLAVPIIEIYVIIQVGQVIGALPTVALLLAESALGAWIVKHEGRRAWAALQDTLRTGRMPDRELANAALILIGGTLLLTPGFVTDIFGFAFVLPFTRPVVRRLMAAFAHRRLERRVRTYTMPGQSGGQQRGRPQSGERPKGQSDTRGRPGGHASFRGPSQGTPGQKTSGQNASGKPRVVRGDVIDDE